MEEMCRLCLRDDKLKPLFDNADGHEHFSSILLQTTGLQIELNDGLPQVICDNCTESVNLALNLRTRSQDTENILKKMMLENDIPNKKQRTIKKEIEIVARNINDNCFENLQLENVGISVEFEHLTDAVKPELETSDFDIDSFHMDEAKDTITSPKDNVKEERVLSKKEKREQYLQLVEGDFVPNGPVKCKICKKTLSKWTTFLNHCKLHLGFKFVCEYCGKSFVSITQLNRHCRSRHGMQRELACTDCDYMALDNAQLALHKRRVHTGDRPFTCNACGASYFNRKCLVQHLENHNEVKSIQCDKCPRLFRSRRHLSRHTYTSHTSKEYTYRCPICNQTYRNYKYVRIHLKKLHSLTTKDIDIIKIKLYSCCFIYVSLQSSNNDGSENYQVLRREF